MFGNSQLVIDITCYYDNVRWPKSLKINLMLAGKCYRLLLSHVIPREFRAPKLSGRN